MSRQKRVQKIGIRLTSEELNLAEQMAKDLETSVSELFRYKTLRTKHFRFSSATLCHKLAELNLRLKPIVTATEQALWTREKIAEPAEIKELIEKAILLLKQVQWQQMNISFTTDLYEQDEDFEDWEAS
ncbi:MAG TPA: hypothetical protein DDW76_14715 [Cyanobacteria bacterium UBA11369]|nr:hypothetical protein [Cyanobacteria bacterium UBA11371]HBE17597.1 hypothetical protein [Cyanobacteria bacterium UBA11367]HBE36077.1 hypothetical protein [Cyanobacteria bacterium UBA11368]HBE50009.1 hypothetical protein [Cyanobacteria bacterium UBA11369]